MRVITKKMLRSLTSLRWYIWDVPLKLQDHSNRHCSRNSSESNEEQLQGFIIIRREVTLSKRNLKLNIQKHHFVCFYELTVNPNFIISLCFLLDLIRQNSCYCHIMELFKGKEKFKENVRSNYLWTTVWPKMLLD